MTRFWLCAMLVMSGCVATDVGNPQTEPAVEAEVQLKAFEEELPNALTLDDGVELTHVWVATERIKLSTCETETEEVETETGEETELEYTEPTVTDLLTGTSFPGAPLLRRNGKTFCGFELRARPLTVDELPVGAPADLVDASFVVRGVRKDGRTFVLRSDRTEEFELDGEIQLDEEVRRRLAVGFAVNGWVTQRDLGPLVGDPIRIDADNNTPLLEAFTEVVGESVRVFDGAIGGPLLAD